MKLSSKKYKNKIKNDFNVKLLSICRCTYSKARAIAYEFAHLVRKTKFSKYSKYEKKIRNGYLKSSLSRVMT